MLCTTVHKGDLKQSYLKRLPVEVEFITAFIITVEFLAFVEVKMRALMSLQRVGVRKRLVAISAGVRAETFMNPLVHLK